VTISARLKSPAFADVNETSARATGVARERQLIGTDFSDYFTLSRRGSLAGSEKVFSRVRARLSLAIHTPRWVGSWTMLQRQRGLGCWRGQVLGVFRGSRCARHKEAL